MNYRHSYHAGNAADVFKHIVLIALLQALCKKDKPFCYLETHAGEPLYPLNNKEHQEGIDKLVGKSVDNNLLKTYLDIIEKYPGHYPGSATIAQTLLRPQDRMVLSELHPEVAALLKDQFKHVHIQNGYTTLKACTPPPERRGLILIDPCYEAPDEWKQLPTHVYNTWQRWKTGIYALWYPIKNQEIVSVFKSKMKRLGISNILVTELCPWPTENNQRLNGSGMMIINPPWQLETELKAALPCLLDVLRQHPKGYAIVTNL
ncbi:MAG: 23S rRNA (adenine(2030)-N(6))-methyltransferase RlmJ [Gammaproteobacteria bacterium]